MERALKGIGKRCFVNCFEEAMRAGGILTPEQIIQCDPEVGRDWNGLAIRASYIRKIFNCGWQCDALLACANARRLTLETRKKARELFRRYCA